MPLFSRYDGDVVQNESVEQRILPFLMRTRNESVVYYEQAIDAGPALAYLERVNADRSKEDRITLFHLLLASIGRALCQRPKMNRFVKGNLLYQRKWTDLSFMVKKELHDESATSAVKLRFDGKHTLDEVASRVAQKVRRGRSVEHSASEKEMALVLKLPSLVLRAVVWFLRLLDSFNLMPGSMIEKDELYATAFIAYLGTISLDAPWHHLYEWGTISTFGVLGQLEKRPVVDERGQVVVKEVVPVRWTFDERVVDGFYAAGTMALFKHYVEHPSLLERPGDESGPALRAPRQERREPAAGLPSPAAMGIAPAPSLSPSADEPA